MFGCFEKKLLIFEELFVLCFDCFRFITLLLIGLIGWGKEESI